MLRKHETSDKTHGANRSNHVQMEMMNHDKRGQMESDPEGKNGIMYSRVRVNVCVYMRE